MQQQVIQSCRKIKKNLLKKSSRFGFRTPVDFLVLVMLYSVKDLYCVSHSLDGSRPYARSSSKPLAQFSILTNFLTKKSAIIWSKFSTASSELEMN